MPPAGAGVPLPSGPETPRKRLNAREHVRARQPGQQSARGTELA
jgi:hypothetical protein